MMHRAWSSIVEVPYCFSRVIHQISRSRGSKNRRIWPKLGVSGQQLQFEFTDGYEMLHKAWNSKGEVPYCFPRSSIKFQGHTGQNITEFDPNWAFPDYRPVAAFKSLRFALFLPLQYIKRNMVHTTEAPGSAPSASYHSSQSPQQPGKTELFLNTGVSRLISYPGVMWFVKLQCSHVFPHFVVSYIFGVYTGWDQSPIWCLFY